MLNIKLEVSYEGTAYFGFQRQAGHTSIQQVLEEALEKTLGEFVRIAPAGRTDTGVHALRQVVSFKTHARMPIARLPLALNTTLPSDIRVLSAKKVPDDFHARFSAKGKRYRYTVFNDDTVPPFIRRTVYRFPYPLDVALMKKGARMLTGRHDFRSFQGRANRQENTVRRVRHIDISKKGKQFFFTVEGDGFLTNMVRNLVGTLLLVGRNKLSLNDLGKILEGKDRRLAGPTAPALGLTLLKVFY